MFFFCAKHWVFSVYVYYVISAILVSAKTKLFFSLATSKFYLISKEDRRAHDVLYLHVF